MMLLIFLLVILGGVQVDASELDVEFQRFLTSSSSARSLQNDLGNIRNLFKLYQKHFCRRFTTAAEERASYAAFRETLTLLFKISQQGNGTCTFELNDFADKTPEELKAYRGVRTPNGTIPSTNAKPNQRVLRINADEKSTRSTSLPTSFDYTTRVVSGTRTPILTPIRNQGSCGSCYAFAFNTLLEAQQAFHFKSIANLSDQQIVDCSTADNGCVGGYFTNTFSYFSKNLWRSNSASSYSYKQKKGKCVFKSVGGGGPTFPPLVYQRVTANNAASMQQALVGYGPLWVSLFAGDSTTSTSNTILRLFSSYRSGIIQPAGCPTALLSTNHAVVIVGYGVDAATKVPFWKVRNSWGIGWGEQGYFRIRRGVNMCGIESGAFYMARTG